MKIIYAPWREEYARSTSHKQNSCAFCLQEKKENIENFILYKGTYCFIGLNKYPYNAGHLLILPYAHVADLFSLEVAAQHEAMELISYSSKILQEALHCEGLNVGLNLGKPSGGSIPDHIHFHVLPRWTGDTNFLPVFADAKVVSVDLKEVYLKLKPYFDQIK